MRKAAGGKAGLLAVILGLAVVGAASAGERRYHVIPGVPANVSLSPVALYGPPIPPPRPNTQITYRHPATGQPITVPLQLPFYDTPKIFHRVNRIVYEYSSDTVEVIFLPDGSVDVVYNSGLLRAP